MADEPPAATPNRRTGRKTVLTPELQAEILKAIEVGDSDVNACACVGINKSTLYEWIKRGERGTQPYKDFADALPRARATWRKRLLASAVSAVQGSSTTHYRPDGTIEKVERRAPDGRLALKLLAVRHPHEFSERHIFEQRHTGGDGTSPVLIGDAAKVAQAVATMTPAQLRAFTGTGTDDLAPDPEGEGGGER